MLQYTAGYFNVKHVLLNFLQGYSQPTLEMGTKVKTCQFKAMVFIVFPFCGPLKVFQQRFWLPEISRRSNNGYISLPMDPLAILHRLRARVKTAYQRPVTHTAVFLSSGIYAVSPFNSNHCLASRLNQQKLLFLFKLIYILYKPDQGSWLVSSVILLAVRKRLNGRNVGPFPFSDLGAGWLVLRTFPGLFDWGNQLVSVGIFSSFFEGTSY